MTSLTELAETMQSLLGTRADDLARQTGFVRRRRKISGSNFAQTLVFAALAADDNPKDRRRNTAATVGLVITDRGFEKRLGVKAADFLLALIEEAVTKAVDSPVVLPLLQRFTAVEVLDGSTIALPDALAGAFRGGRSGTTAAEKAALKLNLGLDLLSGRLTGLELTDGRAADLATPLATADRPAGALHLADQNYFSLEKFHRWDLGGSFWLSRFKSGTTAFDAQGHRLDLVRFLEAAGTADVDVEVGLGTRLRVPCRLIARRVPPEVAERRRQRLREKSRRRGDKPSALSLALCAWTVLVTNVPRPLLSVEEAVALARLRWQIELIFKLWKDHGTIDEWHGSDPEAALCQVLSKLLAQVVGHWVMVSGAWSMADRSLVKAARVVQCLALSLAQAMRSVTRLRGVLSHARTLMQLGARMERRTKRPRAHELIFCLDLGP